MILTGTNKRKVKHCEEDMRNKISIVVLKTTHYLSIIYLIILEIQKAMCLCRALCMTRKSRRNIIASLVAD